jgi:uridine kinase
MHPSIGISGGTSSGKTAATAGERVNGFHIPGALELLEQIYGFKTTILGFDRFYKDAHECLAVIHPQGAGIMTNWDCLSSLHMDEAYAAARSLSEGKRTRVPIYSFKENRRVGDEVLMPEGPLIMEGLYTLLQQELFDRRIFFAVDEQEQYARRALRGEKAEMWYFTQVILPEFRKHEQAMRRSADVIIDAEQPKAKVRYELLEILVDTYSLDRRELRGMKDELMLPIPNIPTHTGITFYTATR